MVAIYSQLVARRYAEQLDEKGREYLSFTLQGAKRMEMLLKDLLAYSQAGDFLSGTAGFVEAGEVLDRALLNLHTAIEENGAQVTRDSLPRVQMEEVHLLQLFQNLVGNAIKYRKPDQPPRIHVTATAADGYQRFCVSDNGIGIPEGYRVQIFGIFKRLHSGDKYAGTGIGLAICQRIVERYGGRIWVEPQEGGGSSFCFTLPVGKDGGERE